MASQLRFLQLSDLFAGAASSLDLPPDRHRTRDDERATIPRRVADLARAERVDVVLAPGHVCIDDAGAAAVIDAFAALAPLPVFLAPGPDDPASPIGPYAAAWRTAQNLPSWPSNVHVFTSTGATTVALPSRADVTITGFAHTTPRAQSVRPFAHPIARAAAPLSLLVLHGTLLDAPPDDTGDPTFPFMEREFIAQGFTYAALGGRRAFTEVRAGTGRLRGAYAGAASVRSTADAGQGAVLVGTIDGDVVEVTRHVVDPRASVRLAVDVSGVASPAALWDLVRSALDGVTDAGSIVRVDVTGTVAPGLDFTRPPDLTRPALQERFFAAEIDLQEALAWADLPPSRAKTPAPSLEDRYVAAIRAHAKNTTDPSARDVLDDALHAGLLALRGHAVVARDELA